MNNSLNKTAIVAIAVSMLMLLPMSGTVRTFALPNINHSTNVVVVFNGQTLPSNAASIISGAGGEIIHSIPEIGVVAARATSVSSDTFIANLQASSSVNQAGYDITANLIMPTNIQADDGATSVAPDSPVPPPPSVILGAPACDRYYSPANGNTPPNQWAIYRVGGFGATPYGPAGGAWDTSTGSPSVTVAILDTGISFLHPDVAAKIVNAQSSIFGTSANLPYDDGSPEDQQGHGTWTASLAAGHLGCDSPYTLGGVVGVAPQVSLADLKVLVRTATGGGSGEFSWVTAAIVYGANQGYQVESMSLGGYANLQDPADRAAYTAILRATNYAFSKGTLVVAAAGNDGLNLDDLCNPNIVGPNACYVELPGSLPNVIAVTATTNPVTSGGVDGLASYSNYGTSLHGLAAPGGDSPAGGAIGTTGFVRGACGPGSNANPTSKCFTLGRGVYYVRATGTSGSTPLVSGAAALVYSVNPGLKAQQVRSILYNTAQDVGPVGYDAFFQFGIVDATAAVHMAQGTLHPHSGGSGSVRSS